MGEQARAGALRGRTVVVTGGTRGIGRAVAVAAAASGADVFTLSRGPAPDLIAALTRYGVEARTLVADVTDATAVMQARDEVLATTGRVDALVNNAGGLVAPRRPFWNYEPAEFEQVIDLNLRSVYVCSAVFSEPMRAARCGRIVNVGSDGVGAGLPHLSHYLAAKAGVVGLTRGMASDLGPFNITVNVVSPGLVVTETNATSLTEAHRRGAVEKQRLGRNLVPADLSGAIVFLLTDAAAMITGQVLQVNGGATMGPT